MPEQIERSKTRVRGFDGEEMDFQLIRQMGSAAYGGASVGQCLALVGRIADGDPSSWVREWESAAVGMEKDALARADRGHGVSAMEQYLKASNAYRAAEYYTEILDPAHRERGLMSRACFLKAMEFGPYAFEEVWIPFERIKLPAYFIKPSGAPERNRTILGISGFDGTLEETFCSGVGRGALDRGWNVLLFAGPGQMDTMRFHPEASFRPDYEKPVSAAVDYALSRSDVDPERLGLVGISFGGYFATRAAAHDSRIRALVANSPIVDLFAYLAAFLPFDPLATPEEMNFRPEDLDSIPDSEFPPERKVITSCLIRRFGRPSFRETFEYLQEFRVGDALSRIRCPCLALVGEGEGAEPRRQFEAFLKGVSGPATGRVLTALEGADTHCQVGNAALQAAETCDWMEEALR